jgi:transcription elongation factor Elf1
MGGIMQKVQKVKFVFCPNCGQGQYITPKLNEELGDVTCETCGATFNAADNVVEPQ